MKVPRSVIAAWLSIAPALSGATCTSLDPGRSLQGGSTSCFSVVVTPGEPALLAVQQPVDLEIRVIRIDATGPQRIIDAFDHGTETATIETPGKYRVEVRAVSAVKSPISYLMSRKPLPLQEATIRIQAEDLATESKHTPKQENIAAALAAWEQVGDQSAIGRTYINQGDFALAASDLVPARTAYEQALQICTSASDFDCVAIAANNSGLVSWQLADFDPSLKRLTEAAVDFKREGERDGEGTALTNLGLLFWQAGDYQRAIGYYDQAGGILRSREGVGYGRVLNNLGLCYQSLAEYDKAAIYFERALREFTLRKGVREATRARLNLGRTRFLAGNNAVARSLLEQALAEADANSDRIARAGVLRNLGQVLLAEGHAAEAGTILRQSLELDRALGSRGDEAVDLHHLGGVALAAGDVAGARADYTEANQIRHDCGLRDRESDSLFALASLESGAGNAKAARETAEKALGIMESVRAQVPGPALRASFYARQRRFFDLLVDLEMTSGAPSATEDGFLTAERGRGRALMDLLAEGTLWHELPGDLLRRRANVQRQLDLLAVRLSVAPAGVQDGLRRQVEILVAQDQEIEASVRQTFADWKLGYPLASVAELQQKYLPRDSALLEYYLGEKESYLWLIERDGIRVFHLPARPEIEARSEPVVRLFSDVLARKRSPATERQFATALHQLSTTLAGPLAGLTLPARLIIVPDGILTRIPFAALELPASVRLGLVHDIVQVPAAAYLAAGRLPRPVAEFPKAILAIADPVFSPKDPRVTASHPAVADSGLSRIPYSEELDPVLALVPPSRRRILRGFDANPTLLESLPLGDYALLHFSTHAIIDDRTPDLSRVALSMVTPSGQAIDGFLRPRQLSQMRLNGSTVVLSACDTALGKQVIGEGLAGFTADLFSAGAAQLVLTLSEVDAEGSSEFFRAVYRNVFGPRPAEVEHAVTLARRSLAASSRWSDPFYWGSFVVYGIPSEADSR